ncbi:hypothetical protein WA026_018372 [Henosepilachna vigintioctopunctata]|uniref:UDP-glycosyltransferase n=1 Tax=Henosepilachna vigintioctopunctata TaxID=420089 RepID=A0AAW1VE89_9CUCU
MRFHIFISLINVVTCARILVFTYIPSVSHQNVFRSVWKHLSLRGHEVVAIATDPIRDPTLTNLTEIDVSVGYEIFKKFDYSHLTKSNIGLFSLVEKFHDSFIHALELEINTEEFQGLLQKPSNYFDLIIVESALPAAFGIQNKFKAPMLAMSSLENLINLHSLFGNPVHPILYPELFSDLPNVLFHWTIWEKIESLYILIGVWMIHKCNIYPISDKTARKHFGNDMPYIEDIMRNSSLMLINVSPVFSGRRPTAPNVVEYHNVHLEAINYSLFQLLNLASLVSHPHCMNRFVMKCAVVFLLFLGVANSAKIFVFAYIPSISHQNVFRAIYKGLSLKGHEVVAVTTDPLLDKTLTNLTEINVKVGYEVFKKYDYSHFRKSVMGSFNVAEKFFESFMYALDLEMKSTEFQELLKYPEDYFDLLIVELHQPAAFGIQHKFKAPMIALSTLGCLINLPSFFGSSIHPILYPEMFTDLASYDSERTMVEKIESLYTTIRMWFWMKYKLFPDADLNARRDLVKELSLRGHEVTFITTNPIEDPNLKNLSEIDVSVAYQIFNKYDISMANRGKYGLIYVSTFIHDFNRDAITVEMKTKDVQEVLKKPEDFYDLILIEAHSPILFGLGHKFKSPVVAVSSLGIISYFHALFGESIHPVLYPDLVSEYIGPLKQVAEKLDSLYVTFMWWFMTEYFFLPSDDKFARGYFGDDMPYLRDLMSEASLLLLNVNPIFSNRRPNAPNIIQYYNVHTKRNEHFPLVSIYEW